MYSVININDLTKQLADARNTLTHTFHLTYKPDNIREKITQDNFSNTVDLINDSMHRACTQLFNGTPESKLGTCTDTPVGMFGFFGDNRSDLIVSKYPAGPLACIDHTRYSRLWQLILEHHCLLATYDKLHDIIFHDIKIDCYKLVRLFGCCGFHYALTNKNFNIEIGSESNIFFVPELEKKTRDKDIDTQTASNYGRNSYPANFSTIKNIISQYFKDYESLIHIELKTGTKPSPKYIDAVINMNNIPLLQQLRGKGKTLTHIRKLYDSQFKSKPLHVLKSMDSIHTIQENEIKLIGNSFEQCLSKTDILFAKYKIEQMFDFDLVSCLTQNIILFDKKLNLQTRYDTTFIETISSAVNFPNTASRHILIQMAFDCYTDMRHLDSSFLKRRLNSPDNMASIDKRQQNIMSCVKL